MLTKKEGRQNIAIYHRGERRVRRVLRRFQSLLMLSGAFAVSMCSAVKFKDIAISLENSTVPGKSFSYMFHYMRYLWHDYLL
uniref:Uncharacterized protein n=1 Tax=Candidatus Methanophagaceae archaeon ANME-1 ERB6 TaxID=2759912 RepID=A0A7G9YT21_9EURY|nr:hypothetical protein OLNPMGDC_00048 [Methanosarcinales archaeon ANME-1 ERB6]